MDPAALNHKFLIESVIAPGESPATAEAFQNAKPGEKKGYTVPVIFKRIYPDQPMLESQSPNKRMSTLTPPRSSVILQAAKPDSLVSETRTQPAAATQRPPENPFGMASAEGDEENYKVKYEKLSATHVWLGGAQKSKIGKTEERLPEFDIGETESEPDAKIEARSWEWKQ